MRKIILIILGLIGATKISFSQKFYSNIGVSYNFAWGKQVITDSYEMHYNGAFDYLDEKHSITRSSIGKGYMGNFTIGYEADKLINFELNLSYLFGKPVSYTNSIFYSNGTETVINGISARSIFLTPSIIFVKEIKSYCPYISIGLTVGFTSVKIVYDYSFDLIKRNEHMEGTYISNPSVGLTTKIGIMKKINDRVGIFGDVSITNITFSPDKRKITKYTINGKDSLSTLNVSQINAEYNDDYSIKYKYDNGQWVEAWNTNAPRKLKKFDIPASFIAINLGVRFYFVKLKKEIPKE